MGGQQPQYEWFGLVIAQFDDTVRYPSRKRRNGKTNFADGHHADSRPGFSLFGYCTGRRNWHGKRNEDRYNI